MTKKASTTSTQPEEIAVEQPAVPQWIEAMHQYYQSNGYYRGADVQRVLGDPTASVKGEATESATFHFGPGKRALAGG